MIQDSLPIERSLTFLTFASPVAVQGNPSFRGLRVWTFWGTALFFLPRYPPSEAWNWSPNSFSLVSQFRCWRGVLDRRRLGSQAVLCALLALGVLSYMSLWQECGPDSQRRWQNRILTLACSQPLFPLPPSR